MPLDDKAPAKADKGDKPAKKRVPALTNEQVREALRLANCGIASDPRKLEAWNRWLILSEQFESLVARKIAGTHEDPDTIRRICKFVDVSVNLALDIMDQVCVVWDRPATRHVGLEPTEPPEDMPPPMPGAAPPGLPTAPQKGQEDEPKEDAKKPAPAGPPKPPALNGLPAPAVQPPKPKPKPKANPQTEALRKLYRDDLQVDSWLQDLNKAAWWLTEAVVVPQIREGHMRSTILLPFFYDPIRNPKDPQGKPIGYVYTLRREDPHAFPELLDPSLRMGDIVVLDSESWRIYKHGSGDPNAPHETIKHGLGYVPAVALRFSRPLDGLHLGDYRRHRRLFDSTITCSVISTKLNYIRKAQDRKLPVAVGDFEMTDDGQTADPEAGVKIGAPTTNAVSFEIQDFNTDPANHLKHIAFHYEKCSRAYGGEASESMGMAGSISPKISFSHEAQTEIRVDQIPYARDFERELAAIVCDMAKQNKAGMDDVDLVEALPEPDEIREDFSVQFAPLSRKFANFSEEKEYMEHQKANGLASPYDFAKKQDPDLTDEQARDFVLRKLEEAAEVNDIAASRNLPMDGESGMKTLPEVIGKTGPEARDNPPSKGPPDSGPPKDE
jgi:hypothetical protein